MPPSTNLHPNFEGRTAGPEYRDPETERHAHRVATLTLRLAQRMSLAARELMVIQRGALLHDIGMLNVPKHILLKPELLTEEEWDIVRLHPVYASRMLEKVSQQHPSLIEIPYCHHEKWDGSGYPRGLKGEEIPLSARLFAIADVWDSLTTDRPYRASWTWKETAEYIDEQAGRHFDPQIVEIFQRGRPAMQA